MRVKYAVTFEFPTRPPLTHRGEASGTSAWTVAQRAVREAAKAVKPYRWASFNCVILERLDVEDGPEDIPGATGEAPEDEDEGTPAL